MPSLQEPDQPRLVELKSIIDKRGRLVAVENGADLPFSINRVFFVVGMGDDRRGCHAHHQLHELVVCAAGSCRVMTDNGAERREWQLDRPDAGLHLPPMNWIEIGDFSTDCVLLVLASHAYDEADYIRDYASFLAIAGATPAP